MGDTDHACDHAGMDAFVKSISGAKLFLGATGALPAGNTFKMSCNCDSHEYIIAFIRQLILSLRSPSKLGLAPPAAASGHQCPFLLLSYKYVLFTVLTSVVL